jgi:GT2 family glycosyltransferase
MIRSIHGESSEGEKVSGPTAGLTSVITVNFNAGGHLVAGTRAVLASTAPVELLVVDNASTDRSLDALRTAVGSDPRVRILENDANVGFAKANNQGLVVARGEWLLFLNPDCLVRPDTIERMRPARDAHSGQGLRAGLRPGAAGPPPGYDRRWSP